MSRVSVWIVIVASALSAVALLHGLTYDEPDFPEAVQPSDGARCAKAGGDPGYCRCLDERATARARADQPVPPLPPLDDPVFGGPLANPGRFPIINADTPYCLPRRGGPPADPVMS